VTTESRFCPRCGTRLAAVPPISCGHCSYQLFVNARPTSTVIVVEDAKMLVVRRAIDPHRGEWELPGGFCDGWEHPADAAVREAREELGIDVRLDTFVGMYLGTYDYQDEQLPVLDLFWLATAMSGEIRPDPHEVSEYAWVSLMDPPAMAFRTMDHALVDARKLV
jgi:8-oxo-dGTP diphosphatase